MDYIREPKNGWVHKNGSKLQVQVKKEFGATNNH